MFRWCSYCQHLIGEMPPWHDFRVTHGICEACTQRIATYTPTLGLLQARVMFESLEEAGRSGDFDACSAAIDAALEAGLKPSEVMVGILHPALARIGQLWASGDIALADEHRFTDFALQLIDRLSFTDASESRPLVVLASYPDNCHEIGVRMLEILTREQGIPCARLPAGTSAEAIAETIATRRPDLVGLSVSLLESIPGALALADDLSRLLSPAAELVLGGQAFRRDDTPELPPERTVLPTVDAYLARLRGLNERYGARADSTDPESTDHSA